MKPKVSLTSRLFSSGYAAMSLDGRSQHRLGPSAQHHDLEELHPLEVLWTLLEGHTIEARRSVPGFVKALVCVRLRASWRERIVPAGHE
jgi:hypothetical protein